MVSLGMPVSSGGLGRSGSAIRRDPPLELRTEMPDQPLHRPGRSVAECTDRVALDLVGDVKQHVDLGHLRLALYHALHHAPDPARALAAGRALTAALMHVELREPRDRLHDIGGFVHYDNRGGAEAALHVPQAVEI